MDFVNQSNLPAAWTLGFDPDGRELVVVAIKASFSIPEPGRQPRLLDDQASLTQADEFTGEPGLSAPRYETDYAHRKPLCDVLLNASAYAPGGRPAREVMVAARVGPISKAFVVKGHRAWHRRLLVALPSAPEPFVQLPISYDVAYGGVDTSSGDPAQVRTFLANPVGRGFAWNPRAPGGDALPNTEEAGKPVDSPGAPYRPMSFGPIGRSWSPRLGYAGTYGQRWLDEQAPFYPDDFDTRYFLAAPPDQQMPFARGGEPVSLVNLTRSGRVDFALPRLHIPVLLVPHQGEDWQVEPVIDTVLIEPDLGRFMLTWRASVPMRRSAFDMREVVVGRAAGAHYRLRRPSHRPRSSLADLVQARQRRLRAEAAR
ncbi:DUF2169 domain-containing protein [Pseudorhodoferax sp. Leaf267]|uniref:DUF2169 family type VI secretion system accessory protein n=1 Tax=Pseudorhodoferax sp. Leaf267 TaxID=1736316 RepID=UPI0006F4A68C|nr:DUF2169 domain-containing protein [Pseudorhodoferax sp. Leaf267]KQP22424.1 hypothetical protein ASF43_00375 [Pseudorhodoferax sp. Leaf267]